MIVLKAFHPQRRKTTGAVLDDESGVTGVEYGLIAALVGIALVGTVSVMGDDLGDVFSTVTGALGDSNTEGEYANFQNLDFGWNLNDLKGVQNIVWGHAGSSLDGWENTGGHIELVRSGVEGVITPDGGPWMDMEAGRRQSLNLSRKIEVPDGLEFSVDFFANDRGRTSGSMDV